MNREQRAATKRVNCPKCGADAGDPCFEVKTIQPGSTGLPRVVEINLSDPRVHRNPHPVRMVAYRRDVDAVTRIGDLDG